MPRLPVSFPTPGTNQGHESSSEQSDASQLGQEAQETNGVSHKPNDVAEKGVCRAHLLCMARSDGASISPKPCMGRRVKPEAVLTMDWFFQHGKRVVASDGPVMTWLCGKHREYYAGRKAEYRCQIADSLYTGILMEFTGGLKSRSVRRIYKSVLIKHRHR